jgi:hypothetical protein
MGYKVDTWEVDFRVPAGKVAAALADINANPGLQRPCRHRAHMDRVCANEVHDCQRTKPFEWLTEAVEELTGFHDCEEDGTDGFRLGYHLDKWQNATEEILYAMGPHAVEGSYVRFIGEENELFGYRVADGKVRTEDATVVWTASPIWPRVEVQ